jgi:hypothetical protein
MKKVLIAIMALAILLPAVSFGESLAAPVGSSTGKGKGKPIPHVGTMTVKEIVWNSFVGNQGVNKLFTATAYFSYVGDPIDLGYDYSFALNCSSEQQKRGGRKTLFGEYRDLTSVEEPEVEGTSEFKVPFTFTFSPSEFESAKRRYISCSAINAYGAGIDTVYGENADTYVKVKANNGGNEWVVVAN